MSMVCDATVDFFDTVNSVVARKLAELPLPVRTQVIVDTVETYIKSTPASCVSVKELTVLAGPPGVGKTVASDNIPAVRVDSDDMKTLLLSHPIVRSVLTDCGVYPGCTPDGYALGLLDFAPAIHSMSVSVKTCALAYYTRQNVHLCVDGTLGGHIEDAEVKLEALLGEKNRNKHSSVNFKVYEDTLAVSRERREAAWQEQRIKPDLHNTLGWFFGGRMVPRKVYDKFITGNVSLQSTDNAIRLFTSNTLNSVSGVLTVTDTTGGVPVTYEWKRDGKGSVVCVSHPGLACTVREYRQQKRRRFARVRLPSRECFAGCGYTLTATYSVLAGVGRRCKNHYNGGNT